MTPRTILALMLAAAAVLGVLIVVDAAYLFTVGGWPLHENGKLSHGLYHRLAGLVVLGHCALFYAFALRLRRPNRAILPLYLVSLAAVLAGSLMATDMAWKAGPDLVAAWPLAIAALVAAAAIYLGTEPKVAASTD